MSRIDPPIRVAVVTGTRAEFGLLTPIIDTIQNEPNLRLHLIITGTHLLPNSDSFETIRNQFPITETVVMQLADKLPGRASDVQSLARGIAGLGAAFTKHNPHVVLVLGDRIEALAAALAASIGGTLLAHIHGGDRAQGVADEAMRHAITKLAHIHFPATPQSAQRIKQMGEDPEWVHVVGSPAIDDLSQIPTASDTDLQKLNLNPHLPFAVILHHPTGFDDQQEYQAMMAILNAVENHPQLPQNIIMAPNYDPGRSGILRAIGDRPKINNLPRPSWIAILKRASHIIGNSSAGLIESAALGIPCVNIGPRQAGRERAENVIDLESTIPSPESIAEAIQSALNLKPPFNHPYGAGRASQEITRILASLTNAAPSIRKRNQY